MSKIDEILKQQPLLLFDGDCGFCNKIILFFLKYESSKTMHFVSLKSESGKKLKQYFEINASIDSIILIKNYSAYIKSCAALRLALYLKGIWKLLIVFIIIPPFIRNFVYDIIAKHRKKIIQHSTNCEMLSPKDAQRFIH
ncbi:MAG: DUF393 domain-containing protein [Bacteroidetes bacterium]|nr:DUF393 domain-containing protein [Bacteroidota bacterium]